MFWPANYQWVKFFFSFFLFFFPIFTKIKWKISHCLFILLFIQDNARIPLWVDQDCSQGSSYYYYYYSTVITEQWAITQTKLLVDVVLYLLLFWLLILEHTWISFFLSLQSFISFSKIVWQEYYLFDM